MSSEGHYSLWLEVKGLREGQKDMEETCCGGICEG